MSFFKNLSGIFKKTPRIPSKKPKKFISPKALVEAETKSREIILDAKQEAFQIKTSAESQARQIREEAEKIERKMAEMRSEISQRLGALQERERFLPAKEAEIKRKIAEINKIKKKQLAKLERAALLSQEKAKELILQATEKKLNQEIALAIKEAEEEAKRQADKKVLEILIDAMRRAATDYVPEYTVSTVKIGDEEVKGRVIGKEGRNIRTFEKITGIDVDLDEEGVIRLSSFDPIRREVAKVALQKLIADGRIQPSRIEEIVQKTKKDLEKIMHEAGEQLCHKLKVYNLPRNVVDMLGRFKYRFSYGQNMIAHTLEETKIGVYLASELGLDTNVVKLGCLLHDIGKVITEEEGSHVKVGVSFLQKYGIPQKVLDCVAQHHEDEEFTSAESITVYIADAISGARPGARYEDYEEYVKRMKELENLVKSFEGVKNAYAIAAGREVRVIVDPGTLDDAATIKLAFDIKEKIKKQLTYPGQIKVTAIREFRKEETA